MRRRVVAGLGSLMVLAACSSSSSSSSEGASQTVSVTSSRSECVLTTRNLPVGTHTFEVRNTGSQPTEVYVYAPGDKIISEKKGIGPGSTAKFTAKLARGYYQVACKPGQEGDGIREAITVA